MRDFGPDVADMWSPGFNLSLYAAYAQNVRAAGAQFLGFTSESVPLTYAQASSCFIFTYVKSLFFDLFFTNAAGVD